MPTHDVVVAGLGGFGSSIAYHLARRGLRVLGLDPRPGAHTAGASHGESRIVRQAYFEGTAYVPLLRRSYELFADITRPDGSPMLRRTGGLFLGAPGTRVLEGSIASAQEWGLDHEVLDATEVARRFPIRPPEGTLGLYEPQAGVVSPELTVAAHLRKAAAAGAELRHDETVTSWTVRAAEVRVVTSRGAHDAGSLVLAPGRWVRDLLGGLDLPLSVQRRVQHWFRPVRPRDFDPATMPVWIWDLADGTSVYGVPAVGETPDTSRLVKAALHFSAVRPPDAWSPAQLSELLAPLLPGLGHEHARAAECWYTLTPDENFVVGRHPQAEQVMLACGFSGHGFKFTPVLGEVLAQLVVDGTADHDLSLFDPRRFAG